MSLKALFLYFSLLLVVFPAFAVDLDKVDYGLTFKSHGFNLDERTGLNLCADRNFNFRKGFTLEFDMRLNSEDVRYGYVFRIISGDSSIDMLSNVVAGRFNLVLSNGYSAKGNIGFNSASLAPMTGWHHVRLAVAKDGITCSIDDIERWIKGSVADLKDIDIRFGWNDHPVFYTTDVPPVSVKEIVISDSRGERFRWPLLRHNEDETYDVVCGRRAEAVNGIWNIDSHCEWTDVFGMSMASGVPLLAFDGASSRLFVATEDSLYVCSLDEERVLSAVKVSGTPVRNAGNQMIYDPEGDRLVCYGMHGDSLAFYDFATSSWTGSFEEPWPPLVGSARWFDHKAGILYVFGGYGNHRYNADLTVIDIKKRIRSVRNLSSEIYPRYFSAMCSGKNGHIIVLGGFGNMSGRQEEAPGALNDICMIDINTLSCDSLSTFKWEGRSMIFASSMVLSEDSDEIYALAFSNNRFKSSLNLLSIVPGGTAVRFSSPIPFNFHDTDSYADLAFSRDSSRFYAIVLNTEINGKNELKVYSLAYPPVSSDEIIQQPRRRLSGFFLGCLAFVILSAAALAAYLAAARRRIGLSADAAMQTADCAGLPAEGDAPLSESESGTFYNISLLGGLKIYDKEKRDVTSKLTPMLRQLFLYFFMRTFGSDKAVTAEELNEVFWFGMEKSAASNNRNVNMRKLRGFLQDIGDISLNFSNDIITLTLGDDIRCDWLELIPLLKSGEKAEKADRSAIAKILRIAGRGTLLSGYEYDWLDKFKSEYAELLISVMMKAAADPAVSSSPDYMLGIAECILREDSIDEFALRTKVGILYRMGHKGLSKQVYDKWCSDYRKMMDSNPDMDYRSLIPDGKTS